jgi:NADH:ubiquinone oxidoreductase subunit 5 (subunit L)/multisubunit Na+/H+ antiporter MnhA subunit
MGSYKISVNLIFDWLGLLMTLIIVFISGIIHIFTLLYLSKDEQVIKFNLILSFFTLTMVVLVLASNLIVLFIG